MTSDGSVVWLAWYSTTSLDEGLIYAVPDDQDLQAQCLTLLTNAIVCWNTVYLEAAIDHLRSNGSNLDDDTTRRLSPTTHEHIDVYGRYDFTTPTAPPPGQLRPLHSLTP